MRSPIKGFRLTGCSKYWFFSEGETVGCAWDVQNHGHTGKDPLSWWVLCLELGWEDVSHHTVNSLVNWALVNSLVFFISQHDGLAVNDWYD